MDKRALVTELSERLAAELTRSTAQARDAAAAATHEENRAEGDKDMRATEASYVARGQAQRAVELETAIAKLAAMPVREFKPGDRIAASAIVELDGERRYFLVTAGGGEQLGEVTALATTSPLGRALLGLEVGDEAEVTTPQGTKTHEITGVQ